MNKKAKNSDDNTITVNKKAGFEYFIEQRLDAGVVLQGWEVKSLRAARVNLTESYVIIRRGELWLLGANISPLSSASTHVNADPTRTRKLLLHRDEIKKLIGHVERKGYTIVPLRLYWQHHLVKACIGLAKGKKDHDKRATEKERDWQRDKQRLMKKQR